MQSNCYAIVVIDTEWAAGGSLIGNLGKTTNASICKRCACMTSAEVAAFQLGADSAYGSESVTYTSGITGITAKGYEIKLTTCHCMSQTQGRKCEEKSDCFEFVDMGGYPIKQGSGNYTTSTGDNRQFSSNVPLDMLKELIDFELSVGFRCCKPARNTGWPPWVPPFVREWEF